MGRTFPNRRANAGPDQNSLTSRSSSGRCALSRHLAEGHPQVLIIAHTFVSPGGQTQFFYDPPASRGTVGTLSGQSLTRPDAATSLNDYRDQIVVLNLWGSWCAPCRTETPDLEQTATATRSDGVQLLGINVKDSRTAAADYVRNREVSYPSIYDPAGRTMLALRGIPRSVVPLTIVLDRHHRVAAVFLTTVTADELIATVQRLAAEK